MTSLISPTSAPTLRPATVAEATAATRFALTFRRSTADEERLLGVSKADLRSRYAELWPAGWRLRQLRGQAGASGPRYSATWSRSWRSEISVHGVALDEFAGRYERLWPQHWRLRSLQAHRLSAGSPAVGYTAIWEPSSEPELQAYDVAPDTFLARHHELSGRGWRLKSLSVVEGGSGYEPRYTALWRPSLEPEIIAYDLSQVVYQARYERLWLQGWRLKLLAPFAQDGRPRFTAVWSPSPSPEIQVPDAGLADLEARYRSLQPQGWRLALLAPYTV